MKTVNKKAANKKSAYDFLLSFAKSQELRNGKNDWRGGLSDDDMAIYDTENWVKKNRLVKQKQKK